MEQRENTSKDEIKVEDVENNNGRLTRHKPIFVLQSFYVVNLVIFTLQVEIHFSSWWRYLVNAQTNFIFYHLQKSPANERDK